MFAFRLVERGHEQELEIEVDKDVEQESLFHLKLKKQVARRRSMHGSKTDVPAETEKEGVMPQEEFELEMEIKSVPVFEDEVVEDLQPG